jgi:hypothetical protein
MTCWRPVPVLRIWPTNVTFGPISWASGKRSSSVPALKVRTKSPSDVGAVVVPGMSVP